MLLSNHELDELLTNEGYKYFIQKAKDVIHIFLERYPQDKDHAAFSQFLRGELSKE